MLFDRAKSISVSFDSLQSFRNSKRERAVSGDQDTESPGSTVTLDPSYVAQSVSPPRASRVPGQRFVRNRRFDKELAQLGGAWYEQSSRRWSYTQHLLYERLFKFLE